MANTKAERTRNLRYKRPALASLGYEMMISEIWDIQDACGDVQWFVDNDDDTLLNALDGDEEAEWEFKVAFADLSAKSEQLLNAIRCLDIRDEYDDCTVALIGNRYKTVGYDFTEEDYFSLTSFESDLASTEAGKRLMRHTKAEVISIIGRSLGILISFLDLRQQYDYLKATMDILRDENTSLLKTIKAIDAAYEAAAADEFVAWKDECVRFDKLLSCLPERVWVE